VSACQACDAGGFAECKGCNASCSTACTAELQSTGRDPYRIQPPDVLSICVPMLEPTCAAVREKLSAKGIALNLELPCGNVECEQTVAPDGRISINGIGDINVSGMTIEEARLAITKKIFDACPQASRAAFAVIVDVAAANSKKYYVITRGAGPGDNVIESPITASQPVAITLPAIALPTTPYCPTRPTAAPVSTTPIAAVTPYVPCAPSATQVAAFPEPIPSPFARQACPSVLSSPLIATQAFISEAPLPAAPVPAAKAPQCAAESCACSAPSCEACCSEAAACPKVAQVLFSVEVIEDHTGSLREFKALESAMPILTAQSEVILPTIRILEKQALVRRISSPKLVTIVDQPAQIQIGSEVPGEASEKPSFQGLSMRTAAREMGGGLNVDFEFRDTSGGETLEVQTSLLVAHGQTIVMKAAGCCCDTESNGASKSGARPAVYVVLTPELVK
jgi:hypothetical protein